MKIEELNGTQLFMAGSILCKIAESLKNQDITNIDEDSMIVYKYISGKIDELNKEVAGKILESISEGMERIRNNIEEN